MSAFSQETPGESSRQNASPSSSSSPPSSLTAAEAPEDLIKENVTIIDPIARATNEKKNIAEDTIIVEGREFLNDMDVKFLFPIDDQERERILKEHVLYRYLWKGNYSAPVEEDLLFGAIVLDVA